MSEIRTGCNDNCPYYYENTGCLKPDGLFCPPMSTTIRYEVPYDNTANKYSGIIEHISDIFGKNARDAGRIDKILEQIGEVWKKSPHLRLGQLILNVLQDPILYYIEDEELVKYIQNFYNEIDN